MEIGVLQETKLMEGIYTWKSAGYFVLATEAEIRHWGGITVSWLREKGRQLKGMNNYGPNVVRFMLETGWRRWYVVGEYIPPNDQLVVRRVEQDLECYPTQT